MEHVEKEGGRKLVDRICCVLEWKAVEPCLGYSEQRHNSSEAGSQVGLTQVGLHGTGLGLHFIVSSPLISRTWLKRNSRRGWVGKDQSLQDLCVLRPVPGSRAAKWSAG